MCLSKCTMCKNNREIYSKRIVTVWGATGTGCSTFQPADHLVVWKWQLSQHWREMTGLYWTALRNVCPAHVWSHCLLLSALWGFITLDPSRLSLSHTHFYSPFSFLLSLFGVQTHTLLYLTECPDPHWKHQNSACDCFGDNTLCCIRSCNTFKKHCWDKPVELLTCVQTHYLNTQCTQTSCCHFSARMNPKPVSPAATSVVYKIAWT